MQYSNRSFLEWYSTGFERNDFSCFYNQSDLVSQTLVSTIYSTSNSAINPYNHMDCFCNSAAKAANESTESQKPFKYDKRLVW